MTLYKESMMTSDKIPLKSELVPCDPHIGETVDPDTSDGYHTFKELYEHRNLLFITMCHLIPSQAWRANNHDDGTHYEGYFIAGLRLPCGDISYHLEDKYWKLMDGMGIKTTNKAPKRDGHTSQDVIARLRAWIEVHTT